MPEPNQTNVYLTIDTESSMGGAWDYPECRPLPALQHVFCDNGNGAYGLPLIVSALQQYDMRATFFCEMLATYVLGEADTRSITDFLLAADQDVQLHLHPVYRHYYDYQRVRETRTPTPSAPFARDQLCAHPEVQQLALLQEACAIFRTCTGYSPLAFRAGNFAANRTTLSLLRQLGIVIDSSFNPAYVSQQYCETLRAEINLPQKIGDIWELPITVAKTRLPEGNGYRPFDVGTLSTVEMETILNCAHEHGMEHVTILFHCAHLVKPQDIFYSSFRPNWIIIRRLKNLLQFLSVHSARFVVRPLRDLARHLEWLEKPQVAVIPHLGLWCSVRRKVIQGLNNFYWL